MLLKDLGDFSSPFSYIKDKNYVSQEYLGNSIIGYDVPSVEFSSRGSRLGKLSLNI